MPHCVSIKLLGHSKVHREAFDYFGEEVRYPPVGTDYERAAAYNLAMDDTLLAIYSSGLQSSERTKHVLTLNERINF